MSAHSPGPWWWKAQPDAAGKMVDRLVDVDGREVLRTEYAGELTVNERLAAAAPELLAALKGEHRSMWFERNGDEACPDPKCATCALIARIEGAKPSEEPSEDAEKVAKSEKDYGERYE